MNIIVEFILANYVWILLVVIIILLAIIGWYADKTNFGQGVSLNEEKEKSIDEIKDELGNKKLLDEINGKQPEEEIEIVEEKMNFDPMTGKPINNIQNDNIIKEQINNMELIQSYSNSSDDDSYLKNLNIVEEQFDNFDKVFDEIIPKKDIIDEELLDEIDNLTFEKSKKTSINDIPDLDDIDLPKIKQI